VQLVDEDGFRPPVTTLAANWTNCRLVYKTVVSWLCPAKVRGATIGHGPALCASLAYLYHWAEVHCVVSALALRRP